LDGGIAVASCTEVLFFREIFVTDLALFVPIDKIYGKHRVRDSQFLVAIDVRIVRQQVVADFPWRR
jgi:hypothetical protein